MCFCPCPPFCFHVHFCFLPFPSFLFRFHRFFSVSTASLPFVYRFHRFFTIFLPFVYRFVSVSFPFRYRFFTVSVTISFPFPANERNGKEMLTALFVILSISYIGDIWGLVHMCLLRNSGTERGKTLTGHCHLMEGFSESDEHHPHHLLGNWRGGGFRASNGSIWPRPF
jgi:hypothetical protein